MSRRPKAYVINDVSPPIVIGPPSPAAARALRRVAAGAASPADARRCLEAVCGDQFDRVWGLVGREHVSVLVALLLDMAAHFGGRVRGSGRHEHGVR